MMGSLLDTCEYDYELCHKQSDEFTTSVVKFCGLQKTTLYKD